MSTAAQITANRLNAQSSTGPKSVEGKAASSANATKHGLSGAFRVLPNEDQDEFDVLLACMRDEFKPATQHEAFLVEQMAQARWKIARIQRIEAATFDQMLAPQDEAQSTGDSDHRIAQRLLSGGDRTLTTLQRYASAAERSYYKAHAELMRSRQVRNEAKTVEHLDAAVLGRIIDAPVRRRPLAAEQAPVRNGPKFMPQLTEFEREHPALRL